MLEVINIRTSRFADPTALQALVDIMHESLSASNSNTNITVLPQNLSHRNPAQIQIEWFGTYQIKSMDGKYTLADDGELSFAVESHTLDYNTLIQFEARRGEKVAAAYRKTLEDIQSIASKLEYGGVELAEGVDKFDYIRDLLDKSVAALGE